MNLTPPDNVQLAMMAAYLQVLQRQTEPTMDVARSIVPIPAGYDLHRVSVVPSMMRARGLIRQTAVCRSRRGQAKCSKSHAHELACCRAVAEGYLTSLREQLGPSYPLVTDEAMRIAEPRVISRLRRPKPDSPGQLLLPLGD